MLIKSPQGRERGKKKKKLHFDSRDQHSLISIIEQSPVKVAALEVVLLVLLVEDIALRGERNSAKRHPTD